MKISYVGVPPQKIIKKLQKEYPKATWIDLDTPFKKINKKLSNLFIPKTTCSIIQTILSNALTIKPDILIATVGYAKCDSMNYLIPIIKNKLPKIKIIKKENNDKKDFGINICESDLNLTNKFNLIIGNVLSFKKTKHKKCLPKAGFWGVPPFDYSVLKLFPKKTHIFGWTRCMENKTPNNIKLELYIEKKLPTVFFSQAFCPKNILAKELARKNNGLYVEVDGLIDSSTKEKIKAFLELKNCY
jgi:hypothetical protein